MTTLAEKIAAMKGGNTAVTQRPVTSLGQPLPQQNLRGGNRLADIRASLAKASTSGRRVELPCGTGWFLLKNGSYKQTEQKGRRLSSFSFLCINPISDGDNMKAESPNYSGPRKWEEYEVAIFQDGGFLDSTMTKNLQALAACMGWHSDYVKQLQSTEEGITCITELLKGLLCVDITGFVPTNQPCAFANQVVVELHTKASIKDEKGSDGLPSFDAAGKPKQKTFVNTYWNKKIFLDEVLATIGEADTLKAFGSEEAFVAAYNAEKQMAEMMK